jgi:hypothetical protein
MTTLYEMLHSSNELRDAIDYDTRKLLDPEIETEVKEQIVRVLWTMRETSIRMDESIDRIYHEQGL